MNIDKIPKIRVLVRKRPISKKQLLKNQTDIIEVLPNNQTVLIREQKYKVDLTPYTDQYKFNFDGAYGQAATNQQIYLTSVRPLVDCAFDGARVSCFAYGQTGSGKTYTMLGDGGSVRGLYLIAAEDIFNKVDQFDKLTVWISFYQIYCGKLYDLLNERNILFARQDAKNNVNIVGLSERKITSVESLMQIIEFGTGMRVTAQNGTNVDSSRSHAILQIGLKIGNKMKGKISFIDLAGSQRAADHADQLEKQTRIDGAEINKSLLALKQCIRALDQNKNHTPFRGSKLTMVLKDSFTGGYCKTVMIGNVSPNSSSCQNTLNTLKYADRVKQLKKPNKDMDIMQMDNLDKLSKQLMLPRQAINHTKLSRRPDSQQKDDYINRQNFYLNPPHGTKQPGNINNKSLEQPTLFTKSNKLSAQRQSVSNSFQTNPNKNSPYSKNRQSPQSNKYQNYRSSASGANQSPSTLIQQQQPVNFQEENFESNRPSHYNQGRSNERHKMNNQIHNSNNKRLNKHNNENSENLSLEQLTQKHENYIQLVIQQQQQLLKTHKQHINSQIQLVKNEMMLMNQVDQIGSNVQDYLESLQQVLQKQLISIYSVKDKINKMKADLKQSQKIQTQYLKQNQKMNHYVYNNNSNGYDYPYNNGDNADDILLDDDENLFR